MDSIFMHQDGYLKKNEIDALILFANRWKQLQMTKLYQHNKINGVEIRLAFNSIPNSIELFDNFLKDENDEYIRSFLAIFRLFSLDNDHFSLRYMKKELFSEDTGMLYSQFPNEAKMFLSKAQELNMFLDAPPVINININDYKFENNGDLIWNYIYGGIIHSNSEKLDKFYAFNLYRNEGKRYITYRIYRADIIIILIVVLEILEQIINNVILPILDCNFRKLIDLSNKYKKENNISSALKKLDSAIYMCGRLEDNQKRLKLYQMKSELLKFNNDLVGSRDCENICKDIQEVLDKKVPDFSEYTKTFKIHSHYTQN